MTNYPGRDVMAEKCVDLWRAVLYQAIHEARGLVGTDYIQYINGVASPEERRVRRGRFVQRCQAWFSLDNPDFVQVCNLAMLDPVAVLDNVVHTFPKVNLPPRKGRPRRSLLRVRRRCRS